jgi:uncharacterized protein with PIN domain
LAASIKLYLDENMNPKIAQQLRLRGIDAIHVLEVAASGESDTQQLARATEQGRALVTTDSDFIDLASQGVEHAGIIFGAQESHSFGDWVRGLELICFVYKVEDMKNHVEYL